MDNWPRLLTAKFLSRRSGAEVIDAAVRQRGSGWVGGGVAITITLRYRYGTSTAISQMRQTDARTVTRKGITVLRVSG